MSFFFFILVNAALFIRLRNCSGLVGWRIYEPLIPACAATRWPELIGYLTGRRSVRSRSPCAWFGLLLVIVLSFLSRFELDKAADKGVEFTKVVVYYLLAVERRQHPARLRSFLSGSRCSARDDPAGRASLSTTLSTETPAPPPSFRSQG